MYFLHGAILQFVQFGGLALVGVAVGMWIRGRREDRRIRSEIVSRLASVASSESVVRDAVLSPVPAGAVLPSDGVVGDTADGSWYN